MFRAIWAIIKPTIHPETLSKTFILGGKNDYLPIFQREGLAMPNIPKVLGGASAGLTARQFVSNARAMALAAKKVYPSVPAKDLLRVAAANLPVRGGSARRLAVLVLGLRFWPTPDVGDSPFPPPTPMQPPTYP